MDSKALDVSFSADLQMVDQIGLIPRSTTTGLLWWSVCLSSLTEIDPSFHCDEISVHLYTEGRNGRRKMQSFKVNRLFGSLSLSKLPSGGRVSAAIGILGTSGFTHVVGCNPVLMPAKSAGNKRVGQAIWSGSPTVVDKRTRPNAVESGADLDARRRGFVEHLPWEMPR